MFGVPASGWTDMYIGNREYLISYNTDVPIDFLTAMVFALKEDKDFCVWVDCEYDYRVKIISDYYDTYIIADEELDIIRDLNKWQIAQEIYNDFRSDFDEWCGWLCYKDEEELKYYPEKFMRLLDSLSAVLRNPRVYLQNTEMYGSRQVSFYKTLGLKKGC